MRRDKADVSRPHFTPRVVWSVVTGILLVTMAGCGSSDASSGAKANLNITPGPYHDGQLIDVSVGSNHYFNPYSGIKILECADPGGTTANLPTNVSACDGNTIQGGTILVNSDGSFSRQGYEIFALPNASQLGEPDDNRPVCNETHYCVLYIGQNQEKFTAPKIWSPPFTVSTPSKRS